jgi:hypothetical protein
MPLGVRRTAALLGDHRRRPPRAAPGARCSRRARGSCWQPGRPAPWDAQDPDCRGAAAPPPLQGATQAAMQSALPNLRLEEIVSAVNRLMGKKTLQLFQQGNTLVWQEIKQEDAVK